MLAQNHRSQTTAEQLNAKEIATFEEILLSNVYTQEALIHLLEAKGIIRKAELLEEIKRLKRTAAIYEGIQATAFIYSGCKSGMFEATPE